MVDPGWYDDPLVPGGQRWWTGQAWSEQTQPPPAMPPPPPPGAPPPPAPWQPGGGPVTVVGPASAQPWALADIGDWFTRSFRAVIDNIPAVVSLYCALPAALAVAGYIAARTLLGGVVIFVDEPRVETPEAAAFVVVGVILVAIALGFVAASLGGLHFLASIHRRPADGSPPDPLRSLGVGLTRIPRLIWVVLLLTLGCVALVGGIVVLGVVVSAMADAAVAGVVVVLAILAAIPLMVWLYVKLAFVEVTVAAAPLGTSAIGASAGVSSGRFWPVLGRLLLAGIIGWVLAIPFQIVNQGFLLPAMGSAFTIEEPNGLGGDTTVLVDGVPIGDIVVLDLDDVLPDFGSALPLLALSAALYGATRAFSGSLLCALYVDAEGRPRPPRR